MGSVVLRPVASQPNDLYTHAHCLRDRPGGVTVLAINAGIVPAEFDVPISGERYMLTSNTWPILVSRNILNQAAAGAV